VCLNESNGADQAGEAEEASGAKKYSLDEREVAIQVDGMICK